jgi:uncharacterized protein GlcG (DUF336 family)
VPRRNVIALERARAVVDRILERTTKDGGRPVAIAVVDDRGDPVAFARQDGVTLRSLRLAQDKAYTSALQESSTKDFVAYLAKTQRPLGAFADPRYVALSGGVLLKQDGELAGAVGVSGRSSDEDNDLAEHGAAAPG